MSFLKWLFVMLPAMGFGLLLGLITRRGRIDELESEKRKKEQLEEERKIVETVSSDLSSVSDADLIKRVAEGRDPRSK